MKPFVSMSLFTIGVIFLTFSVAYFINLYGFADRFYKAGNLLMIIMGVVGLISFVMSFRTLFSYINETDNRNERNHK